MIKINNSEWGTEIDSPHVNARVSKVEREVFDRLALRSGDVRNSISGALGQRSWGIVWGPESSRRRGAQARRRNRDIANREHRRPDIVQKGENAAIRAGVDEHALGQIDILPLPDSFTVSTAVEVPKPAPSTDWESKDRQIQFNTTVEQASHRLRTEDEIAEWIAGNARTNARNLRPEITIFDPDTGAEVNYDEVRFTPNQAREFAKLYRKHLQPYENLQSIFAHGGVSEANVRTALDLASQHPESVASLFTQTSSTAANEEITKLQAQKDLVRSIESLTSLPGHWDRDIDMADLQDELTRMQEDEGVIAEAIEAQNVRPPATPPPFSIRSARSKYLIDQKKCGTHRISRNYPNVDRASKLLDEMAHRRKTLEDSRKYYEQFKAVIEVVYSQADRAGLGANSALSSICPGGKAAEGNIGGEKFNGHKIADDIKAGFDLKSAAEIDKEIADKRKESKASGANPLRGAEAVKAVYEKHFQRMQKGNNEAIGEDDIRAMAVELYGRNQVGKTEMDIVEKSLERKDVFGKNESITGNLGRITLKEPFLGTQQAYMRNLSDALGKSKTGFWKFGSRPAWGAMEYEDLLKAYYALREATNKGYLANSTMVNNNKKEVANILVTTFFKDLNESFDALDTSSEDGTDAQRKNANDQTRRRTQQALLDLLRGSAIEPHGTKGAAMAVEAYNNTAKIRKATGRAAVATAKWTGGFAKERGKDIVGLNTTRWYNPLTYPSGIVKGIASAGKAAGRYLGETTSPF